MRRKTLVRAGHMALLDKHLATGVESSLYFDPQLGESVIVPTKAAKLNTYTVSLRSIRDINV